MKRIILMLIAIMLCLTVFSGCEKQDAELSPFEPPTSKGVSSVSVSSFPGGYNYLFTGEDAQKVTDYFSEIELTSKYDENPNELTGMTLKVTITYDDGNTETLYEISPFIRTEDGAWYMIIQSESSDFYTLLNELAGEE